MKKKLYIGTLVLVMILGVFVTASNAQEIPSEDVTTETVEMTDEDMTEETDVDTAESDEIYEEDNVISTEDEENVSEDESMVEVYLGEDDIYVYTAVYDEDADIWFLYESCKHCELAGCTETTPEEIYDRFNVKVK